MLKAMLSWALVTKVVHALPLTWDKYSNILDRIGNSLHLSWANEHSLARFTSSFPVATRSEKRTKSIRALLWLLKVLSWKSWAEKRRGLIHQSFDITCRQLFAHHYLLHMEKPCCVAWSNKNIKLQCSEVRMTLVSRVRTKSQPVVNLFQNDICNCGWSFNSEAAKDYIKWEFWPLMTIMSAQKNESHRGPNETLWNMEL